MCHPFKDIKWYSYTLILMRTVSEYGFRLSQVPYYLSSIVIKLLCKSIMLRSYRLLTMDLRSDRMSNCIHYNAWDEITHALEQLKFGNV